jgi:hypothetical protein
MCWKVTLYRLGMRCFAVVAGKASCWHGWVAVWHLGVNHSQPPLVLGVSS